ncbi:hypothetical protein Baya_0917 [Bagarius yarrelli]|uniref:DUF4708 domain-containing protein n=1 Tax=Bagarius yarrelli TaxID=175774 RepID=A0A556TJM1_BAGYA|nr:hypothetical protein Baya_0917 [Bagarius yarrelli]
MTGYNEQSLFFIPVPDLKKLCSVFLSFHTFASQVDEGELRNRQVKICREILRLHSDVIACPVLGSYGGIRVITAIRLCVRVRVNDLVRVSVCVPKSPCSGTLREKPNNCMKKGQVISISHTPPPECPFQTYAELQNHWNSMYGYHLPPLNEDEAVYCSVYFKPLGEKLFTYPLCCIRIQPIQCFPRVNLQGALTAFVSDFRRLIENVCGFRAQMTSKPCYHTTSLSRPSIQEFGALPATLTFKSSSRLVLTQLPNVFPPDRKPLSHLDSSPWPLSQPVGQSNIRYPATTNGHGNHVNSISQSSYCHFTETCQFLPSFSSLSSISSSSSVSANHSLLSNTQAATQRPKLVPIFTNKSPSCHVNITKILAEKKKQKQEVAQCVSTVAVKSPSCSLLNSKLSLPRVSMPLKRDHNVRKQPTPTSEMKKNRGEVFESHPKKAKVNIQEVDVVKYARGNQLGKINSATLQAWLKGQGITVRSKDKKENLMSKVMQCLSEP